MTEACTWPGACRPGAAVDDGRAARIIRLALTPACRSVNLLAADDTCIVVATSAPESRWDFAAIARALPSGDYRFCEPSVDLQAAGLGFLFEAYRFSRKSAQARDSCATLLLPHMIAIDVQRLARPLLFARDLINMPPDELGPMELAATAAALAGLIDADYEILNGDQVDQDLPLLAAVGRGSQRSPCLAKITWGDPAHPKVTLVGKGVTFDAGGLSLKAPSAMPMMKKDMGGAAAVLALTDLVASSRLPLRLVTMIACVENMPDGNALRPGDILRSRKGLTIEVDDTDSEGRLILADALDLADADAPALILDFATLTGAQRIACGTELPGYFTADDEVANMLEAAARDADDPLWRLPLFQPYLRKLCEGPADLSTRGHEPQGQAILAALFLSQFVNRAAAHIHIDFMAWWDEARPGRPVGGEAQGLLTFLLFLERFARKAG